MTAFDNFYTVGNGNEYSTKQALTVSLQPYYVSTQPGKTKNSTKRPTVSWRKVMAAYRRGMNWKITCGLTACTAGSAPGPTLGNEVWANFTFAFIRIWCGLLWFQFSSLVNIALIELSIVRCHVVLSYTSYQSCDSWYCLITVVSRLTCHLLHLSFQSHVVSQ